MPPNSSVCDIVEILVSCVGRSSAFQLNEGAVLRLTHEVPDPCIDLSAWNGLWASLESDIRNFEPGSRRVRFVFLECAILDFAALSKFNSDIAQTDGNVEVLHILTNRRMPQVLLPAGWSQDQGHRIRHRLGWQDVEDFLSRGGWLTHDVRHGFTKIPSIYSALTRIVPPLRHITRFTVMRSLLRGPRQARGSVSVIVPARNERENLLSLVDRLPAMPPSTEVVIVEGGSSDDTWPVAQEVAMKLAHRNDLVHVLAIQQDGRGKFDAVRKGFEASKGDVLVILDGDLAVAPEVLGDFIRPVLEGEADVVIGDRLTLGMERGAMRSLNYLANIFLATVITRIGHRTVKDSLCGTKVLLREDWNQILADFPDIVEKDPFGDYSIILGSIGLGRQILNVPTVYRARTYGETNILRFRDGLKLLKVLALWHSRLAEVASVQFVRAD